MTQLSVLVFSSITGKGSLVLVQRYAFLLIE